MTKVLVSPATLAPGGSPLAEGPFKQALVQAGYELVFPPRAAALRTLTEEELLRQLDGIEATVCSMEPYTRRVLDAHPQLKVIARVGVGYDAVDVPAATDHGVAVTIAPGTNQDAVAEQTFALMLALVKGIVPQHNTTAAGQWQRGILRPLRGNTLGLAGLGRIGKAVALRGQAFGMRVIAYDPAPDHEFARRHEIPLVTFDQLLAESDFLSLHLPLTPATRRLIHRETLAKMKPGAMLINTSRGGLVHEADLAEALTSGRLAGAGLDVFENEPPRGSPLLGLDNVVLTPHAAGVDSRSLADMALSAAEAIVALGRGEWPAEKVVNPEVKPRFCWRR